MVAAKSGSRTQPDKVRYAALRRVPFCVLSCRCCCNGSNAILRRYTRTPLAAACFDIGSDTGFRNPSSPCLYTPEFSDLAIPACMASCGQTGEFVTMAMSLHWSSVSECQSIPRLFIPSTAGCHQLPLTVLRSGRNSDCIHSS